MADTRQQEHEDDGAAPGELLIEAARRNNTDLLQEVIDEAGSPEKAAILLNTTKTVLGNHVYHEAALRGNYEVIDLLLDQEGFECDPISLREGDTPLHSAARYINTLPPNSDDEWAAAFLSLMTDAGSDARIKNKANLTPAQLIDPLLPHLKQQLQDAIESQQNESEYVEKPLSKHELAELEREHQEEGDVGSASDSDFDLDEYKKEKERQKVG
ncbi:putative ankyrin repeat-containing protein [Calycina marina]|uniref:Ankyrin repeat-containing protein n=1 Tax=Calycina marina TaxID=1763456 RepID=A0A9P7Z1M0_9HELO|nr:putative ankyrin repeat-containing protein [Calycina marina]